MKKLGRPERFGDLRRHNRTEESEVDSGDEGLRWDPRGGLGTNSDNNNQEHLNFTFDLTTTSEGSSTESDDVTAAGQCDVITRSSSLKRFAHGGTQESGMFEVGAGGGEVGSILETDDINSVASVTHSEEERRQARERSARSVTVTGAEIQAMISRLETEVILRYLDNPSSGSTGEERSQVTMCQFKSQPPCQAQASAGCQGFCGEHYATLVRTNMQDKRFRPSKKLVTKVRKSLEKKKARELEEKGVVVKPPRTTENRERTKRTNQPRQQQRSPRRRSPPRKFVRPKSRDPRRDDIIESGEEINQVHPIRKQKGKCVSPLCRNLLARGSTTDLCPSCVGVLEREKQKKKKERARVPPPPPPPQYHDYDYHPEYYNPRPAPAPAPNHRGCCECRTHYRTPPSYNRYQPPRPCYCSRCVQADDASDEESPTPESPPSSLLVDCMSSEYRNMSDSGVETFVATGSCRRSGCEGRAEENGLCRDCSRFRLRHQ